MFRQNPLESILQFYIFELESASRVEEMTKRVEVVSNLPIWLPSAQQRETRGQSDMHYLFAVVPKSARGWDVSDLVQIVEAPDFARKVEFDAFKWVFDWVSSWPEGYSWELPF